MSRFVNIDRSVISDKDIEVLDMFKFSLLSCGLRISDIITLRWCDIDFEKKELRKIQVKTRGRNIIPLTDEALEILEKWKERHNNFVFGLLQDDFDLRDEEKLRTKRNSITSAINKRLKSISENVQLDKKVSFHMARHSWAVSALEQGMSMSMISSLLGHTSTAITEKVYAEFRQDTKAEAIRNLKLII
jgi:integrase